MRRVRGLAALRHRTVRHVDEERAEPGGLEIAPDDIGRRGFLDSGVGRHQVQPGRADPSKLISTTPSAAAGWIAASSSAPAMAGLRGKGSVAIRDPAAKPGPF